MEHPARSLGGRRARASDQSASADRRRAAKTASIRSTLVRKGVESAHPGEPRILGTSRLQSVRPPTFDRLFSGSLLRSCATKRVPKAVFDPNHFLVKVAEGKTVSSYRKDQIVFSQGAPADAVFYIQKGKTKIMVISEHGKEAVVALLGTGDFCGEGCLAGQPLRISTASAMTDCVVTRLEKGAIIRVLRDEPAFSEMFLSYVLSRIIRVEEDLVDQLFNSSEKRLARLLLLLANFGKESQPEPVIASISQETLAEMIGTTRSRVSSFMNKFRRLGFIDYNGGGLEVHSSLLNVVLHD